jgi:translation initiation factor 2 subunit 1
MEATEAEHAKTEDVNANGDSHSDDEEALTNEDFQCRFYRNEIPENGEIVVVEINSVDDTGGYVRLLEYNNMEAMILAGNTTRKRVKNVRKLLRVGTIDYMQVITTEVKDGVAYIDLSKRTVQIEEVEEKKKFFDKAKIVHLILRLTAHLL